MSPDLLSANPLSLSRELRLRTDQRLIDILRTNYDTQFAQSAPELASFRDAIAGRPDSVDDATLSETFRKTVPLTTYDAYAPLISKFFKSPCRESDVVNLLAPGLPDYIVRSSSTSGGKPKAFPKYNYLEEVDVSASGGHVLLPDPVPKRTMACIFSYIRAPLEVTDEDDNHVKTVHVTFTSSSVVWRSTLGLHPEDDEKRMATFVHDFAAPHAARFINKWRPFLIIHGLFALGSRSLECMRMSFAPTFVELIRCIDAEFDMIVDCIENGTIPDLDGIAEVRRHLEAAMTPDPERAAELRNVGCPSSRSGWCSLAWPNLRSVTCTASGSFALSLPLARSFLGPNVEMLSRGYASAEARIGMPYDLHDPNSYKMNKKVIIEFLDLSQSESISAIKQPVESGKRYENVFTTAYGLWRYRLGDVVEIAGFDPTDGTPVIRFIERRSVAIRFPHFMISEEELRSAMAFVAETTLGTVVEWTATVDERQSPRTIGFFVELANEEVPDASLAGERILDALSRVNVMVPHSFAKGSFGKPTVWIVRCGTFGAFRQMKLDEGSANLGQIKVPVVLPKPAYVAWFSDRVVREL